MSYVIEKPNTPYTTEKDCPMKFSNDDFSLDDAVAHIIAQREKGVPFTFPNSDLLKKVVMKEKWWSKNYA
jgi:hypothetical protein